MRLQFEKLRSDIHLGALVASLIVQLNRYLSSVFASFDLLRDFIRFDNSSIDRSDCLKVLATVAH